MVDWCSSLGFSEKINYLEVWLKVFTSDNKGSYKNVLDIIELLLITPTTTAKLERMFSQINIKTNSDFTTLADGLIERISSMFLC